MDSMISGGQEPARAEDRETIFARISYRLSRLYNILQENRRIDIGISLRLDLPTDAADGGGQGVLVHKFLVHIPQTPSSSPP